MEGDTPSWLNLIPNGLSDPEHPDWGGWGGRYELYKPDFSKEKKGGSGVPFEPETRAIWTNAIDSYSPYNSREYGRSVGKDTAAFTDNKVTLWRWRDDFQNDFAARMDWCTKSYKEANHPPVIVLSQPDHITVKSGEGFGPGCKRQLRIQTEIVSVFYGSNILKPVTIKIQLTCRLKISHGIYVDAPEVEKKETIHIILKVTDKGTPALSRYKRIIVTVLPK